MDLLITGLTLTACYVAPQPAGRRPGPDLALTPRPAKHRFNGSCRPARSSCSSWSSSPLRASALRRQGTYSTTGLTYAEYARRGFGQLVVVASRRPWCSRSSAGSRARTAADRSIKRGVVLTMTALSPPSSSVPRCTGSGSTRGLWFHDGAHHRGPRGGLAGPRRHPLVGAAAAGWSWAWAARVALFRLSPRGGLPLVNLDARVVELNAARYEGNREGRRRLPRSWPGRLGRDRRELPTRDGCLRLTVPRRRRTTVGPRGTWAGADGRAQAQVGTPTGVCPHGIPLTRRRREVGPATSRESPR